MKHPKRVTIIELENAPFRCAKDAVAYAKAHGINPTVEIVVLYGCAAYMDYPCRVKTTIKKILDSNEPNKAYSYEISNIEVLKGNAGDMPLPSDRTSMDVDILLNGVCDVNGVPLVNKMI